MSYTIKEVSERLGLPSSTIRYYDKQGLLPFLERKESGYRLFNDESIQALKIIECLKSTGMSLTDIAQFMEWVRLGDASLEQRYKMFKERRAVVQAQLDQLQKTMEVIDYKCWYYQTATEAGTERIHNDPECKGFIERDLPELLRMED